MLLTGKVSWMKRVSHGIFSKLVIFAVAILLQVLWFVFLVYFASENSTNFNMILSVLTFVLALYLVNRNMEPNSKLSWVFIILWMPVVGVTCYYLFGRSELSRRTRREMEVVYNRIVPRNPQEEIRKKELKSERESAWLQANYLSNYANYPLCREWDTRYFSSGEETYEELIKDLKMAKEFIFLEFFIMQPGKMLDQIVTILGEKVKEGVIVRIIYDDVGCINTLPPKYYRRLQELGIRCACFNPFKPILSITMNNRDHRKIVVIDGKVAYTGGFNLADEYINAIERFGYWKDAGIRMTGEGVNSFTIMFLQMWNYIVKGDEDGNAFLVHHQEECKKESGFLVPFSDTPLDHENVGENVYLNMISHARKYVYIYTPYLIIDDTMSACLINAAKSGVDVRIVTPGVPDKKMVFLLTQAYYEKLIAGGVKIYQFTPGFLHAKCFIVDGEYATVGSINLDYRSLYHHFECGVWMYHCQAISMLEKDVFRTIEQSEHITMEFCKNRNIFVRLVQCVLHLFAPLI